MKKIKFPLILKEGKQVRTLEELRENFDLEKICEYFSEGKLLAWLEDRYYETEVDQIKTLQADDYEVAKKLCGIFGIEYQEQGAVDIDAITTKRVKRNRLKQLTDNEDILRKVDQAAFDQEELAELLDDGYHEVFLCDNCFTIPLGYKNRHYIGLGNVTANMDKELDVSLDKLGITFENVGIPCIKRSRKKVELRDFLKTIEGKDNIVVEDPKAPTGIFCDIDDDIESEYTLDGDVNYIIIPPDKLFSMMGLIYDKIMSGKLKTDGDGKLIYRDIGAPTKETSTYIENNFSKYKAVIADAREIVGTCISCITGFTSVSFKTNLADKLFSKVGFVKIYSALKSCEIELEEQINNIVDSIVDLDILCKTFPAHKDAIEKNIQKLIECITFDNFGKIHFDYRHIQMITDELKTFYRKSLNPIMEDDISVNVGKNFYWNCPVCGYKYNGKMIQKNFRCPVCTHPFSQTEPEVVIWECIICGYQYTGEKMPKEYKCPLCGSSDFKRCS